MLRDLYAIGFDPVLRDSERPGAAGFAPAPDVAAELALIRDSNVIVLVYPIWFGMPPAIIKGYIDRVLGAGLLARDIKSGEGHGPLEGKRLVILSSSASTMPWLEEHGQWASLRQAFDTYLTTIFAMARQHPWSISMRSSMAGTSVSCEKIWNEPANRLARPAASP